jgi:hypothetical protein
MGFQNAKTISRISTQTNIFCSKNSNKLIEDLTKESHCSLYVFS